MACADALCYTAGMSAGRPPARYARRNRPVFSRLALLLLFALCVLFVSSYANRLARKEEVELEIAQWEQRIAEAELQQRELQAELDYVNSPAYIEDVARNQLDMAREGDTVLIVLPGNPEADAGDSPDSAGADGAAVHSSARDEPTWRQWISLLSGEE